MRPDDIEEIPNPNENRDIEEEISRSMSQLSSQDRGQDQTPSNSQQNQSSQQWQSGRSLGSEVRDLNFCIYFQSDIFVMLETFL